ENADLAAHVYVRVDLARAVDPEATPAAHGDVLTELADERLTVLLDRAGTARVRRGADVRALLRGGGGFHHCADELLEVLVAGGEVRLDVHLGDGAALAVRGDEHGDLTLLGDGASALGAL